MVGQITLKDVAAHAGVSRTTASYVVMGTGRVSQKTRDRVNQSIRTLGYVYNRGAASLRTQRSSTIGVIVTNISNPFFGELLVGLEAELTKAGFLSLVVATADDPLRQDELVTALREHQIAGLAVVPASGTRREFLEQLKSWGIPHVLMTRYLDGVPAPYVGPDDMLGGKLAAEHLLEHGSRSFAYVGGPVKVLSRRDRIKGVLSALAGHGLEPGDLIDMPGETSGQGGLLLGEELLSRSELPDAIICHSDSVAFGLYRALRIHGRTTDVRVIGYDDISGAALWEPPLTSIATHGEALGRSAARLLLEGIGGSQQPQASPAFALPELVIRESCGCP